MILVIGEILYDLFPDYKRLGGAPFNFAFHLKSFGFPVRFISRVGNDADGREILQYLEQMGFSLDDIQVDDNHPTGSVQVRLDPNGNPEFNISPNVAYDHIEFIPEVHTPLTSKSELIYFGSLVQRSASGFKNVQAFLACKSPTARCLYDINLRLDCYNDEVILTSLSAANILKINQQESEEIKSLLEHKNNGESFIKDLMRTYSLEVISLTKGDQGSIMYTQNGIFSIASTPIKQMVDAVGAGDAYAAMLAVGLLEQWPPETVLHRATAFASQICMIEGAIPVSTSIYEPFTPMIKRGQ